MVVKTETQAHAVEKLHGIVILSAGQVKADQDGIKTDLSTLDARIHANAVQCLIHAEKHGDTSLFRRLLVDIVDAKSGYRRQGLIAWMRTYSPLILVGDKITLGGKDPKTGERLPFKIVEANSNPFKGDTRFREVVPFFQQGLTNKMDAGIKEFKAALANTKDGEPIDASKPYFAGTHSDKVIDLVEQMEKLRAQLPPDNTRDIYLAQKQLREALGGDKEAAKAVAQSLAS